LSVGRSAGAVPPTSPRPARPGWSTGSTTRSRWRSSPMPAIRAWEPRPAARSSLRR
jgi:hypothetical protein